MPLLELEFSQPNCGKCRRSGTLPYACSAGVVESGKLHPKLWGSWGLPWVCRNLQLEGSSAASRTWCMLAGVTVPPAWRGDGPSAPACPPAPCPWGSAKRVVLLLKAGRAQKCLDIFFWQGTGKRASESKHNDFGLGIEAEEKWVMFPRAQGNQVLLG